MRQMLAMTTIAFLGISIAQGQQLTPSQTSQGLLYGQYVQSCGLMNQVGIIARGMLGGGHTVDEVTSYLIQKYAYGSNGEVLEGSSQAEKTISSIVASVDLDMHQPGAYPPEVTPGRPEFFLSCKKDAWLMAQRNAQ